MLFDENVLVFTHTPKCGGTTLDRGLRALFGRDSHYRVDTNQGRDLTENTPEERAQIHALTGHFRYGSPYVEILGRNPLYIATVREPISRVRSYYSYFRKKQSVRPDAAHLQRFSAGSLDEVVTSMMDEDHFFTRNDQCHFVSGRYGFRAARKNIRNNYLIVVTPPAIDDLLEMIREVFKPERRALPRVRRNPSASNSNTFSPEVEARLRERTAEDARLFEWVKKHEATNMKLARQRLRDLVGTGLRNE